MAVYTCGGKWEAEIYETLTSGSDEGCKMRLKFTPNKLCNSNKIGLIQCMTSNIKLGKNFDQILKQKLETNDPRITNPERVKAMRTDGTGHLDRHIMKNNPVYGAPNMGSGTALSKCSSGHAVIDPPQKSYRCGKTGRGGCSAALHDEPMFSPVTNGDHNMFETAAMSLDGSQKNVWYGSVKWGWEKSEGSIVLIPLEVVGMATPSPQFVGLVHLWNRATDQKGGANIQVPMTSIDLFHTADQFGDLTFSSALKSALGVRHGRISDKTDKSNIDFVLSYLGKPAQRQQFWL